MTKDKNKKKIVKKTIDIESEFVGLPVAPLGKKEKKSDLTEEIKKFISEPKNLESIKEILMRLDSKYLSQKPENSKMKVYGFKGFGDEIDEFIIIIKKLKFWTVKYYLTSGSLYRLKWISGTEDIDTSILKQRLRGEVHNWFCNNLDQVIIIPD